MARLAIGKTGVRMDIPLMLYQSPDKENGHPQEDEVDQDNKRESEGREIDNLCASSSSPTPSPPPLPPPSAVPHVSQRNLVEAYYSNTPKWRARREETPEKIDYYL
ncbi:unnamed protein product [Rodentolepis nana]|uniref:WW domain-containing protein n=1 Tax=Rodentolepis nana TaxID=102285 RepID=A0A0R3T3D7_RODNA|nr:unnamed protein product [Rodentolepis nana]